MNISSFLRITQSTLPLHRNINCWTAGITKVHRKVYVRTYPTPLVLPDGSSINIDYDIPRRIITLPLDLNTLSELERRIRMERRKTITKVTKVEEYQDDFDETKFYKIR